MSISLASCKGEIVYNKFKLPFMIYFILFLPGALIIHFFHSLREHIDPQLNKM